MVEGSSSSPLDGCAPTWAAPTRPLKVEDSVPGIVDAIASQAGRVDVRFLDYRGRVVPWRLEPQRRRRHRDSLALGPGGYGPKSHPFVRTLAANCTGLPPSVWTSARHPCADVPQTHIIRLCFVAVRRRRSGRRQCAKSGHFPNGVALGGGCLSKSKSFHAKIRSFGRGLRASLHGDGGPP